MEILKNIPDEKVLKLKDLVKIQEGQVVSKTLVQNSAVSITIFAFDKNEEISKHASDGDALVSILDGKAQITIGDTKYEVKKGESIVMPATIPHALYATDKFKMILTVVF